MNVPTSESHEVHSWECQTFRRKGMEVPYSYDFVRRLDSKCHEHGKRQILLAKDESDEIHAALYIVWYEESAYALMSGINPNFKSDGALKLLYWEAMRFAREVTKRFDFEGSMLLPIERKNRSFGAIQVPYSSVSKTNSFRLKLLNIARQLFINP
jgi:lipid II:glycine glycyltransferase (peptidoglycan interpeptide bridge formation enzyme)